MSAGAVDMTMLELFRGRVPHADYFDIEVQSLIRERMIAVQRYHVAGNRTDREQAYAFIGLRPELHPLADFTGALKGSLRYALNQRFAARSIAVGGCNRHRNGIAPLLAFERFLQARNEIA